MKVELGDLAVVVRNGPYFGASERASLEVAYRALIHALEGQGDGWGHRGGFNSEKSLGLLRQLRDHMLASYEAADGYWWGVYREAERLEGLLNDEQRGRFEALRGGHPVEAAKVLMEVKDGE